MANYKLILEYDGTEYYGFQRQPDLPTVQGALEAALEKVARLESPVYVSGRTDAGVHARGQVVNFHGSIKAPPERFPEAVNAFLPADIVVKDCAEAGEDFHARRSAVAREYAYYLHVGKYPSPLLRRYAYHYDGRLDLEKINQALRAVAGRHDFSSFCKREGDKSAVREVYGAEAFPWGEVVVIRVRANAFLWMMMRMLCGSLVEVGRGKWTPGYFRQVLEKKDNSLSGPALPPHGLVLERVYY
jgi:tRNA pseudouridine38-40 synthase